MKTLLFFVFCLFWAVSAEAGSVVIENKTTLKVKVSSIGGSGFVEPAATKTIFFKNEQNGADISIWWVKNARQLCQFFTPWDRTITVTGKYSIQCMSKK